MIPYPLRPVKKFPQKINLALPKPPKKQISLHRGEKSDVFSRGAGSATSNGRRWAPATKKPSKICGTRPGRWAARRVMVDGGRGGVAATKTRKNLRHAAGGRRVVPGGRGSIFFARTAGRGGAVWPQQKTAKTYDMQRAARRVMVDGGWGGVAATKTRKNLRHAAGRRVVSGGRVSLFSRGLAGGSE